MVKKNVTRRDFIQTAAVGATVLSAGIKHASAAANERVRLAWVGTGGRGQYLLRRAMTIDDLDVVAVCDLRERKVAEAAAIVEDERDKRPPTYQDFRKMLDEHEVDGVVVATEVANHAKVVVPILERNINCMSEKPMDATVEAVDAITNAARKSEGIYQVAFQRRFDVGYKAGVKLIHDGTVGEVVTMQGQWHWPGTGHVGGWVGDVDMSGGKLNEQACHHMDLMSWVMGNIAPTHCLAVGSITVDYRNGPKHQAENMSAVSWWFPNGAILSYTHFHGVPDQFVGEKSWVVGKNGGVDLLKGEIYVRGQDPRRVSDEDPSWGDPSVRNELLEFMDCCRTGNTPASNAETARVSTLMTLMAEKAMYRREQNKYGPGLITWDEVGTTT